MTTEGSSVFGWGQAGGLPQPLLPPPGAEAAPWKKPPRHPCRPHHYEACRRTSCAWNHYVPELVREPSSFTDQRLQARLT